MTFTLEFIRMFFLGIYYAGPILLFLLLFIILLGQFIGRLEHWTKANALYFSFITATTVGYGDYKPETLLGKFLAIFIALLGLVLTGIIVALGVKAATVAFQSIYHISLN